MNEYGHGLQLQKSPLQSQQTHCDMIKLDIYDQKR